MLNKVEVRKPGSYLARPEHEKNFEDQTKDVIFKVRDLLEKEYLDQKAVGGKMQWFELACNLSTDEGKPIAYCVRFLRDDNKYDAEFCDGNAYIFADIKANEEHRNVYVYFSENLNQHLAEESQIVARLGEKFSGVNIILHALNETELVAKTKELEVGFYSTKSDAWSFVFLFLFIGGIVVTLMGTLVALILKDMVNCGPWMVIAGITALLLAFPVNHFNTIKCPIEEER